MAAKPRTPRAAPPSTSASRSGVDRACQTLEELKSHLIDIVRLGGGKLSSGLLLAAADNCPEAVIVTDDDAHIWMANSAAARLTGMSTRDLQTLTIWDLTHSASQVDFEILWREFRRARRQRGLYTLRHRDGSAIEVAYCAEAGVLPNRHITVWRKPPA